MNSIPSKKQDVTPGTNLASASQAPGSKPALALLPAAVRMQRRLWGTPLLSRPHQVRQKTLGLDRLNRFPF